MHTPLNCPTIAPSDPDASCLGAAFSGCGGLFVDDYNAVKMIRHYNPIIELNVFPDGRSFLPFFSHDVTQSIPVHLFTHNVSKKWLSLTSTERNEVPTCTGIIPPRIACGFDTIFFAVEAHLIKSLGYDDSRRGLDGPAGRLYNALNHKTRFARVTCAYHLALNFGMRF